ncbi:thioredoxin TrxC [Longimicrobium sp.]|uniref:thioredoxin TrxC n=1 Tax=Longimicrobium sp. TaxID=2029185 RepID=UPI002C8BE1E2|nr:thioredoxin TrxC [Longimicrobium sp.]HSU12908.1 thioredoxin TrxC [Longimicrobium sp.]
MDSPTTQERKVTVACPFCGRLNRVDLARAADHPKCGECGRPILLDRPLALSDASFERVIADAQVPVLVDFYADWCGPCKMVAPIMDELARSRMGSVLIAKLDTDRNQQTAQRFQIASIPTVMVFRDGKPVAKQVGALPRPGYEQLIDKAMQ